MTEVEYVDGSTWHGRTGGLENSFEYKVGFVLLNLEEDTMGPAFFSRRSGKFFGILLTILGSAIWALGQVIVKPLSLIHI